MKNLILASFKEESAAIKALHKLHELESFGDISIYEQVMVRKNYDGKTEILKLDDDEGWRTLTGMGVGSLLGLFGGPVGFVIGLYTGTAIGAIADASNYDFEKDFIIKVEQKIAVGTVTIVAEMEEDSAVFVDNYLATLGAVISRSDVDVQFEKYVNEQIDEIEADIAADRAALKKAVGKEREKIETSIAELKEKRKNAIAQFVAKGKQAEKDMKAKAASSVTKIKAEIEAIGTGISAEVKREKIARLKRRIGRHTDTVNELKLQLTELQD
jgi:uncharacterized membrane protein